MSRPTLYRTWHSYDANRDASDDPTIIRYTAPVDQDKVDAKAATTVRATWCCVSEKCSVANVQVAWQLNEHALPAMNCPACGAAMVFQHYLEQRALEPVDWTGVGRKSA